MERTEAQAQMIKDAQKATDGERKQVIQTLRDMVKRGERCKIGKEWVSIEEMAATATAIENIKEVGNGT
jgi:hypothetical protein